jgi:phosphoglycolate phosphatase
VATNKAEGMARKLLGELGLADRMAAIIGGDTLAIRKPAAEPIRAMIEQSGGGRAAFVGDSIYDVMAARNAGVPSVIVGFGFSTAPPESSAPIMSSTIMANSCRYSRRSSAFATWSKDAAIA